MDFYKTLEEGLLTETRQMIILYGLTLNMLDQKI